MKFSSLVSLLLLCTFSASAVGADRFIFLIKPNGDVFQSTVSATTGPTPWVSIQADVIILRDTGGPDTPVPPTDDPLVAKVKVLATSGLKDKDEATAVAAIIDSIQKLNLTGDNFKQALDMAAPIADASMQSQGRITAFVKAALLVTADPNKLKAGIQAAFGIPASTLETIHTAAIQPADAVLEAPALDFMAIIAMIKMILELLKSLGII